MNDGVSRSSKKLRDVTDVAAWRLCIGCGACVPACPDGKVQLEDVQRDGLRPVIPEPGCSNCGTCVSVCPGVEVAHSNSVGSTGSDQEPRAKLGPYHRDMGGPCERGGRTLRGSSGGLASALALYCIEKAGMVGVAHVGNDPTTRYRNKSVFSRTRSDVLGGIGSRYSPASPCDNLQAIADAPGSSAFVGKPCDIEGLRKVQVLRPDIAEKVGVAIGIFCAGTPSTQGTLDLLAQHGVDAQDVDALRYRGRGWPGSFSVRLKGSSDWIDLATYQEAWGFLQRYRPYRCYLCPDSTSEFADVSCGDPWYKEIVDGDSGSSLVLVRTEVGRKIVQGAMRDGYVRLSPVRPEVLDRSQRELQVKRGAIWGRILALRALGVPAPRFHGFQLFGNWLRIPFDHKVRSVVGTVRRVIARQYRKPLGGSREILNSSARHNRSSVERARDPG